LTPVRSIGRIVAVDMKRPNIEATASLQPHSPGDRE
jgi:hypothetical protein